MTSETLPRLAWRPACRVLLFPLDRRTAKVRQTAAMLSSKSGVDADLYWKQVMAATSRHLARVGQSEKQVSEQLQAFSQAVHDEMVRLAYVEHDSGGAA